MIGVFGGVFWGFFLGGGNGLKNNINWKYSEIRKILDLKTVHCFSSRRFLRGP